jgi:PTS system nitrogen regulatory IIA component
MKISSFLSSLDVTASVPSGSKEEALSVLVDLLVENHPDLDRNQLLNILIKREELRSTGIEKGIAFPHGRVPGLDRLLSCFGKCRQGMDFDSFDGQPTFFFFVLLIPENAQGDHLKALARLNRLFQDDQFREKLKTAENETSIFEAIIEKDNQC